MRILSGVFEGRTTGTSIGLVVDNVDARARDYEKIKDRFRPGHADYAYQQKYGFRDYRGGGRASARITVATVAAGAIARKYLREQLGITVAGWLSQVGPHRLDCVDMQAARDNPFFCADPSKLPVLEDYLRQLRRDGDSVGARVSVRASRVPPGLGEPMFDRLDAEIAYAMMGINAAKAVEIGDGVAVAGQRGSEHRDELRPDGFASNHAGGTLGGISSGQDLIVHVSFKPASSIQVPGKYHRRCRAACRNRDDRPARSLCGAPGGADRRGDAAARAHGPRAPSPGTMRRRRVADPGDHRLTSGESTHCGQLRNRLPGAVIA